MASNLVHDRSLVFDTSAHLPFPPAGTRRYQLAAIDMTALSAENKVRPGRADPHRGPGALAVSSTNPAWWRRWLDRLSAWPVGILFAGLTAVYVSEFFTSFRIGSRSSPSSSEQRQ